MADMKITLHPVDIEKAIQLYLVEECGIDLNHENIKVNISTEMENAVEFSIKTLKIVCDVITN
jgi:hypothetical protein